MTINTINDAGDAFTALDKNLKELVAARDMVYTEIQKVYNNTDLSDEGKKNKDAEIRKAWAETKKQTIRYIQSLLDEIREWDENRNSIDSYEKDFAKFKDALLLANSLGKGATPELLNGIAKMCSNRLQLQAICTTLKEKGADTSAFESRLYNPSELIEETKRKVRECLEVADFKLHHLISALKLVSDKLRNFTKISAYKLTFTVQEPKTDVEMEINTAMGTAHFPFSTSTPIGTEVYVNGKYVSDADFYGAAGINNN